jgi:anthranilate/para-aminobenzoate synthase component I
MYNFNKEDFGKILKEKGSTVLFKKIPADTITPVLASLKIAKYLPDQSSYSFLLESAEKGNNKGRFSIIGLMPDLVWKCYKNESFVNDKFVENKNIGKSFLMLLTLCQKCVLEFLVICLMTW